MANMNSSSQFSPEFIILFCKLQPKAPLAHQLTGRKLNLKVQVTAQTRVWIASPHFALLTHNFQTAPGSSSTNPNCITVAFIGYISIRSCMFEIISKVFSFSLFQFTECHFPTCFSVIFSTIMARSHFDALSAKKLHPAGFHRFEYSVA